MKGNPQQRSVLGKAPTRGKTKFVTKANQVGHAHNINTGKLVVYWDNPQLRSGLGNAPTRGKAQFVTKAN